MKIATHSGDLGDIVYALASLINSPEPVKMHIVSRPWTKEMTKPRYDAISPLVELCGVKVTNREPTGPVDYDYANFRSGGLPYGENLAKIQADFVKLPIKRGPWLKAQPDKRSSGRVLIHRSPRYHNPFFPWRKLADHLGDRLLGVGLPAEHSALEEVCGRKIERIPTENYTQLASLIAGCDHFVGNQSSPISVAIGLEHPSTLEVCTRVPDCLFPDNHNLQYSISGELTIGGEEISQTKTRPLPTHKAPRGGWILHLGGKTYREKTFLTPLLKVAIQAGLTQQEAFDLIQSHTIENIQTNFPDTQLSPSHGIKNLLQSKKS